MPSDNLGSIGDTLDLLLALLVLRTACQVKGGLPPALRARMVFNIALDFAIGLFPVIGDIADCMFRANIRNAILLQSYLEQKTLSNLPIKPQGQV